MMTITTSPGGIELHKNDNLVAVVKKEHVSCRMMPSPENPQYVMLIGKTNDLQWRLYPGTTIDGEVFNNLSDLAKTIGSFKRGGTDPGEVTGVQSVTGDGVSGSSANPVITYPTPGDIGAATPDDITEEISKSEGTNKEYVDGLLTDLATTMQEYLLGKQDISEKGQAGGYAPIGLDGLIPLMYLNVSGLNFKGAWDARANAPELLNGVGSVGDFYKCSDIVDEEGNDTSFTRDFGAGPYTFRLGDWVIFAAGVWQRLGSSESVATVNGKIGNVVITKADIDLHLVNNTADMDKPISTLMIEALSGKANLVHTHKIEDIEGLAAALEAVPSDSTSVATYNVTSSGSVLTMNVPENAPELLFFEIFIPTTTGRGWISLRLNGVTSSVYRSTIHNVNSVDYTLHRFSSGSEIRLLSSSSSSPSIVGINSIRISGTLSNRVGQRKEYRGEGVAHGSSAAINPDISNGYGVCHDIGVRDGKITQLQFRTNVSGATFSVGTTVRVWGIK